MAARLNRFHAEHIREKIRAAQLVKVLQDHVFGQRDLGKTQVAAAVALLRKCVPDLTATQITGTIEHRSVAEVPTDELLRIAGLDAATSGARIASSAGGDEEPPSVH